MANRKAFRGVPMEGWVAHWYDGTARRERDETKSLALQLAECLPTEASVLEVAPGPGYLAVELAKLGNYRITGLDIGETFLQIASMNATREGVHVDFRHGNAADMPFNDDAFDFVICRRALQNFSEPVEALREMRRVLKAGGMAYLVDIRTDVSSRVMNQHVRGISAGLMNWLVIQFVYRAIVKRRAHSKTQLAKLIAASGFRKSEFREGPIYLEAWLCE
jgi:ubiquinone/menaquinone biosynthesis C-methylase UbiE